MAKRMTEIPAFRPRFVPQVACVGCPIQASLGVLGRKWALVVLRDIAFTQNPRFSDILRGEPGLTPRVLSARLKDLQREGFILRGNPQDRGREVRYDLTTKGRDAIPILTAFMAFGFRHHASKVFADGRPRTLGEVLPTAKPELLGSLLDYACETSDDLRTRPAPATRARAK